jgi:hypothetical protein
LKVALIALVLGFVLFPIAYRNSLSLAMTEANIGRLIGGGLAMAFVVYVVLLFVGF